MKSPFNKRTYYILTIDPIHVGTGGYRLGRVDNTITREPGTNLPKIPGSSLNGVARAYTAMAIQEENHTEIGPDSKIDYAKYQNWKYRKPLYSFVEEGDEIKVEGGMATIQSKDDKLRFKENKETYDSCAGKGADNGESHCGRRDCPVCMAFGFSKGKIGSSFQGLAQFFDTRILFFPVSSMAGPVWVTSPSILESADIQLPAGNNNGNWSQVNRQLSQKKGGKRDEYFWTSSPLIKEHLNLGWIYLPKTVIGETDMPSPEKWLAKGMDNTTQSLEKIGINGQILERLVIVSNDIFPRIVNDNLEVRTSVAIDPATGAAEEGALFTYEAIPRATVMWFEIVYSKPEYFLIKTPKKDKKGCEYLPIRDGKTENPDWTWIRDNVENGLALIEHLGIGGMNTRGMGRFRILNKGGV